MNKWFEHLWLPRDWIMDEKKRQDIFSAIWSQYGKRISYFITCNITSEKGHVDDLFQEVMLNIFEHLPSYDRSLPFEAWAFRIARNRCIDHLRTRRQHEELGEEICDTGDDPGESIIRSELDRAIRKALKVLAPDDRQIAYLRYFEELRLGEIAVIMNMNINTVKTRMTAIKRSLRSELENWL